MTKAKLTEAMPSKVGEGLVTLKFEGVNYEIETAGDFIELAKLVGQTFEFEAKDVILAGGKHVSFITTINQIMEVDYRATDGVLHLGEYVSREKMTFDPTGKLLFGTSRFIKVVTEVLSVSLERNEKGTNWVDLRLLTKSGGSVVAKVFSNSLKEGFDPKDFNNSLLLCDILLNKYGYQIENIHQLVKESARENSGNLERELNLAMEFANKEYINCNLKDINLEDLTLHLRGVEGEVQGYPLLLLAYAKMQLNCMANCMFIPEDVNKQVTKLLLMYSLGYTSKKPLNVSQKDKAVMVCMMRGVAAAADYELLIGSGNSTMETELFDLALNTAIKLIDLKVRRIEIA